ncbi:MAG TPA: hypothetical protein VK162_12775 [Streptosporangiaceae bacterium]|nr:hypothetical protein [Streptosporangiaceae bacterium]
MSAPLLAVGATVAVSSGSVSSGAPDIVSCIVRQLPTLGGPYGNVTAAAANGDIVGIAEDTAGVAQPVLWRAGKPQRIRTGLAGSVPAGLNAHGDVVGNSPNGENTLGWAWTGHRTVRLRGTGKLTALPAAISNSDIVVGALETTEGTPAEGDNKPGTSENEQAAVWRSLTGPPQMLAPLPGDQGAHAFAVADDGRIGGISEGHRFRPVVWDLAGKPHALPGLGGGYGIVRAFGPGGVAVGDAVAKDGTDHAVRWGPGGRITDLGLPAGSRTAQASGVLPGGVVVGTAQLPAPGGGVLTQAVRWPAAGQPQLLGRQEGPRQAMVAGAASAQTAVGYRTDATGGRHPVKWRCGS